MTKSHARLILALAVSCQQGNTPGDAPDLGALSMPSVVTGRDGGSAAMIGGQMLWTFNDTLMNKIGADGFKYRSATAAWGTGASTSITDTLDTNGAPFQLVPYTADELAFNSANGPSQRYAMWPDAVVASGGGALIFSAYIQIHSGALGDWSRLGTVVAELQSGQTVAVRQPDLLFAAPAPSFDAGEIVADDGFLYLYSCDPSPCPVARAPFAQATSNAAWQVWNGTGWSSDLTAGVGVIDNVPGQLSISWNAYLDGYLAVHSLPLSNEIVFQTAPNPRGPWSAAQHLMTTEHGAKSNYGGLEHPELSTDGGRSLLVSYANASEGFGSVIHLATPTLP